MITLIEMLYICMYVERSDTCSAGPIPYGLNSSDNSVQGMTAGPIILSPPFTYFGQAETDLYINPNGVLSFRNRFTDCCPRPFPITSPPLIAGFWQRITRDSNSNIYHRITRDPQELNFISSCLQEDRRISFRPSYAFVATWDGVLPFIYDLPFLEGRRNTFQVILTTNGSTSYVMFLYLNLEMPAGAEVGFNFGDGMNYYSIASLRSGRSFGLQNESNLYQYARGVFLLRVDGEIL